jgi:hypothetical protein
MINNNEPVSFRRIVVSDTASRVIILSDGLELLHDGLT